MESYHYAEATAIAVVLLGLSFGCWWRSICWSAGASGFMHSKPSLLDAAQGCPRPAAGRAWRARQDPLWVRCLLIGVGLAVIGRVDRDSGRECFLPGVCRRPGAYWKNLFEDADTRDAVLLTLIVAPVAVVANVVFGVAAAWTIARFRFPGRTLLMALIDLPFSVSPVVAGLMLVLIFGLKGYLGPWLREHDIKIFFATPGLILATAFVTLPFVARELIPVMEAMGRKKRSPRSAWGPAAGRSSGGSRCRTSSGGCSTASFCAMPGRWASSERCMSFRAHPAAPKPCRCGWKSCFRNTTIPVPSRWLRC